MKKSGIKRKKLKTIDMELSLATFFNARTNLIVPNVHWGLDIHECDLLVITAAGYGYEVEIKVTKADLKKDAEKGHGHFDRRIKFLYFAIPDYLEEHIEYIPARAGIILVNSSVGNNGGTCEVIRKPEQTSKYKFTESERYQVARLGALRIWGLKRKVKDLKEG